MATQSSGHGTRRGGNVVDGVTGWHSDGFASPCSPRTVKLSAEESGGPVMTDFRKSCHRLNEPGHAHALTFSCFQRRPFLSRDRSCQWLLDAIDRARDTHHFDLWAYVVMPEHVHILLCPREREYSISSILNSIKKSVSNRAIRFVSQHAPGFLAQMEDRQHDGSVSHRFWQRGGGYDRNLFEPRYIWQMIEYIHANPCRRGLCIRSIDWRWSSALEWECPGRGLLRVDRESVPRTMQG